MGGFESVSKILYILISCIMLLLLAVMIIVACIGAAKRRMRRARIQQMTETDPQVEHDPDYIPGYTVGSGDSDDENDATLTQ